MKNPCRLGHSFKNSITAIAALLFFIAFSFSDPGSVFAGSSELDLRSAEDEMAKAEAEFHLQLKKIKDPTPEQVDRLKKEILEPKREALRKVMGQNSKPEKDEREPSPRGARSGSDIMSEGPILDGSKVEKTMSFPGKKKQNAELKTATPKPVQFKEESAQGNYGSDQIQFSPQKKSK